MRMVYVGIVLLCTLMLTYSAIGKTAPNSNSTQATHQSEKASDGQISAKAQSHNDHDAAILSRAEADSLSIQSDGQMAQSDVGDVKVGALDNNDLIYVLVVVLLVVVILAVVR